MRELTREELYDAEFLMEAYLRRAAIIEQKGGFSREASEYMSANCFGFDSKHKLLNWIKDLKEMNGE